MADDWIKMRGALIDHPKVIAMTRVLHRDTAFRHWLTPGGGGPVNGQIVSTHALRCVTTALLMCVWSVARATGRFVGDDLHLAHSTVEDIDEIAGAPGVGAAMHTIGWLLEMDGNAGVVLPNFSEFNVPMTNAEKQAEYRKRKKAEAESLPRRSNGNSESVTTRGRGREEGTSLTGSTPPTPSRAASGEAPPLVGVFEGHSEAQVSQARFRLGDRINRYAEAAIALRGVGIQVTSQNPDLIAFIDEGGTAAHLIETSSQYPGKPIKYLITAARRELTERAAPMVPGAPAPARPMTPSRQRQALQNLLHDSTEVSDDPPQPAPALVHEGHH